MYAPTMDRLTQAHTIASRLGGAVTVHQVYSWIYRQNVEWPHVEHLQPADILHAIEMDWHPQDYRYFE